MSLQSFLFVAIDKLFNPYQNERKMTKFKDVDFDIRTDIVYDESSPEACRLDTYVVKGGEGKRPVLFYIHGGGFVAGDKHYRRALSRWYANMGYFVVNVNYGLCPEYQCPVPHRQLVAALNWVGAHADELGMDTGRMVVSGDSAGGYYAAMLACIAINKSLQDKLGDLNRIKRFVKVLAFVNSADSFTSQPQVVNGGSSLIRDIFGEERGLPARTAIGTNALPGNIACEIEVLVEID